MPSGNQRHRRTASVQSKGIDSTPYEEPTSLPQTSIHTEPTRSSSHVSLGASSPSARRRADSTIPRSGSGGLLQSPFHSRATSPLIGTNPSPRLSTGSSTPSGIPFPSQLENDVDSLEPVMSASSDMRAKRASRGVTDSSTSAADALPAPGMSGAASMAGGGSGVALEHIPSSLSLYGSHHPHAHFNQLSEDQHRLLVDLHRTFYRGYCDDDLWATSTVGGFGGEMKEPLDPHKARSEATSFLADHVEIDCVYESPFITLQSRKLIDHALAVQSTLFDHQLPSLAPRAVFNHVANLVRYGWRNILATAAASKSGSPTTRRKKGKYWPSPTGGDVLAHRVIHEDGTCEEGSLPVSRKASHDATQSSKPATESTAAARHGATAQSSTSSMTPRLRSSRHRVSDEADGVARKDGSKAPRDAHGDESDDSDDGHAADLSDASLWWRFVSFGSECGEIGAMECYDGFHLGYIDHTLTVDFLPWLFASDTTDVAESSMSPRSTFTSGRTSPASTVFGMSGHQRHHKSHIRHTKPQPNIFRGLIQTAATSCLQFRLHVHTLVEFNESGKIVYVRDVMDLRDIWESVVPFGRFTGWVARRLAGVAVAGFGRFVSSESIHPIALAAENTSGRVHQHHVQLRSALRQSHDFYESPLAENPEPIANALDSAPVTDTLGLTQVVSHNSAPDVDGAEVLSSTS